MDRTRIIFFAIIGIAVLAVVGLLGFNFLNSSPAVVPSDITGVATPVGSSNGTVATPEVTLESPDAIFAPDYVAGADTLPTYICGADAFGSYFTLQQMQMSGQDVEHGFHLGIVPFFLNEEEYDVSEEQRVALLQSGQWNCLLTTLDSVALSSAGVITAIVDESAGADQLWGRGIETVNDLRGKRISFARGSVGEYFVYYALSIAELNPLFDVTLMPQDSVTDAVNVFNEGAADVVSGWDPDILDAETGGGQPILSSSQLRIVIDTIVTSKQSINGSPDLVQDFHDAWFDTLKDQVENFDTAAAQIASWGNNDWSFVYPESASADLDLWLQLIAQADLGDNASVMRDTRPIVSRLEIARRVWAASGQTVPKDNVEDLIETGFVQRSAQQATLAPNGTPVNDTFSITASIDLSEVSGEAASTLAVLPCRRFDFLPESTELTLEARRRLDECVVPTLSQSIGLLLKVTGSSAWPANEPPYTEQEILEVAEGRSQSVVDYLVAQGIDPARFIVDAVLPAEENRNTEDANAMGEDRFVEMTLLTSGR